MAGLDTSISVPPFSSLVCYQEVLLAEFGINIPEGLERALTMVRQMFEGNAPDVPAAPAKTSFALSAVQRSDDMARRLATIPASARSGKRRWPPPLLIPVSFVRADSSRRG